MPSHHHTANATPKYTAAEEEARSEISKDVARTIRMQLGPVTCMMLGARNFLHGHNEANEPFLRFDVQGSPKVSRVAISLAPSDTYTVTSYQWDRSGPIPEMKVIAQDAGIYHDQMHATIKDHTGLDTRL